MLAETILYAENSLDDHWRENTFKEYEANKLLGLARTWVAGRVAAEDLETTRGRPGLVLSQEVSEEGQEGDPSGPVVGKIGLS